MATIFLHQLIPNSPFAPTVGTSGQWEGLMASQLGSIAKATPAEDMSLPSLAQSVPSVWGYARLFHKAWAEADHPKHGQVVEVWRRFVCLMALRKRRQDQLFDIKKIVLAVPPPGDDDGGAAAVTFQQAAALQWPHEIFGTIPNTQVTIAAVQHQREAIGLLLPGIMALPSRGLISSVRSLALSRLDFPLENQNMPKADRPDFYRSWLTLPRLADMEKFLSAALVKLSEWHDPRLRKLTDRLVEFRQDVIAGLGTGQQATGSWAETNYFDPWNLERTSPIRLFAHDFRPDIHQRAVVSVRPQLTANAQQSFLDLVLVSGRVDRLDYAGLAVNENATTLVRDLAARELTREDRERLARDNHTLVISEAELFEPILFRLANGVRYPGHGALAGYLLPLTPLALAILGPRGILDRLSLDSEASEGVQVTLIMPLTAPSVREVALTRIYRQSEIRDVQEPASFAVWPDFSNADASRSEHPIPTLVHQYLSSKETGEAGQVGSAQRFRAIRLLSCTELKSQFVALSRDRALQSAPPRLQPTEHDPGAALTMLRAKDGRHDLLFIQDAAEAIQCGIDRSVALLLIDQRKIVEHPSALATCVVSIDFGTSSTTLAFRRNDRNTTEDLAPHVWLPFHEKELKEAREAGKNMDQVPHYGFTADHFIPPIESVRVPFLSILQVRRDIDSVRRPEPLLGGRIPLQHEPGTANLTQPILSPTPGTEIEVDLKWDPRPRKRELVRHFLREVMLLALGHARGLGTAPQNISWRLSLPILMRGTPLEDLFRDDALAAYRTAMGSLAVGDNLKFPYESDAIYWYLVHQQRTAAAPVTAILDVGGRSTDIAILSESKRSAHGSADLAGRAMLVDFWTENWADFCRLAAGLPDKSMAIAVQNATASYQRTALVDILLNDKNEPLEALLDSSGRGVGDPLLHATRLRVQLGFLGLMYFLVHYGLGMLGKQQRLDTKSHVGVVICGNGSKLFTTFCFDTDVNRNLFVGKIEQWLLAAGFTDPTISFEVTRNPKMEVAIGGLTWKEMFDDPPPPPAFAQARPGFSEQQDAFSLPVIQKFCEAVKDYFGEFLPSLYDEKTLSSIASQSVVDMSLPDDHPGFVGFELSSIRPADRIPREMDPRRRFIIELKALLLPTNWKRLEARL